MRSWALFAGLLFVAAEVRAAEPPHIEVFAMSSVDEVKDGYVLLIRGGSADLSVERRPADISRIGAREWQGRVKLSAEDMREVRQLLFFGRTVRGATVTSEVRGLVAAEPAEASVICNSDPTIFDETVLLRFSPEETKVFLEVKKQRTRILAERARLLMSPENVKRLNQLEREYAIAPPEPIRIGMPYEELVRRLGRIQALVQ